MDLRVYFQKIRELESKIAYEFPILRSLETGDGGKAGTFTEVPRAIAAKMIIDNVARLADGTEVKVFLAARDEARKLIEQAINAAKVQFTLLTTADLDKLRGAAPPADPPKPADKPEKAAK